MSALSKIKSQGFGYITAEALDDIVDLNLYTLNDDECLGDMDENRLLYFECEDGFAHVLGVVSVYGDELSVNIDGENVDADTTSDGYDYIHQLF